MYSENKAFTLMELMVGILIVGILVGIAIPKYLQAVDKSKFSSLQPITRKVQAIQEQYYLSNNRYAEELEDLDIDVAGTVNGKEVKSSEGIRVGIEEEGEEYQYVKGEKENFNNRYIAYQVHSENFGGDTHCEAKQGDNRADKLCKAIGGEYIGEHGEWLAYRLTGSGSGSFSKECTGTPETEGSCSCGTRTRSASCNEKTGEYEYGEWSACPDKPTTEQACSTGTGTQTREVTCKGNSWVTGEWDTSKCRIDCKEDKPAETKTCSSGCGTQTREVSCNYQTGQWSTGEWSGSCPDKPSTSEKCGSGYTNSSAYKTRSVTCNKAGTTWTTGSWSYTACGCSGSGSSYSSYVAASQCASGYGRGTITYRCQGSTWKSTTSNVTCVEGKEACEAKYTAPYGPGTYCSVSYNSTTGACGLIMCAAEPEEV